MMRTTAMLLLAAAMAGQAAHAETRLNVDQTNIFGNRELPKVTFVTPWRDVNIDMPDLRFTRTIDEPLIPLDRETLRLQIEINKQLNSHEPPGRGAQ